MPLTLDDRYFMAYRAVQKACDLIELADTRACAVDGPVSHVRDELSDAEWTRMWDLLVKARTALASLTANATAR